MLKKNPPVCFYFLTLFQVAYHQTKSSRRAIVAFGAITDTLVYYQLTKDNSVHTSSSSIHVMGQWLERGKSNDIDQLRRFGSGIHDG